MTGFNKYSFSLSLIVFVLLAGFFAILIGIIMKSTEKLIYFGAQDDDIVEEFEKKVKKGKYEDSKKFRLGNFLLSLVFLVIFAFAVFVNLQEHSCSKRIPTPRVVQSTSMSNKLTSNEYLYANDLNDQFDMYDVVFTYKLPDEMELELYDIVVYEADGELIIHRIVEIEEPNESHPEHRYFRMQGDGVERPDVFPVLYEQMRGIYTGKRIAYVGSFIMFLQSFAGWLCVGLVIAALMLTPVLDGRLEKKRRERYQYIVEEKEKALASYYDPYSWYGGWS